MGADAGDGGGDALPPPRIAPIQATHVVLRISERRVYLYDGDWAWASYPVAVGRQG